MGIRRGSTPTHIFNTDTDLSEAQVIYITYKQANSVVLEKGINDCVVEQDHISVRLSQEDTLKFDDKNSVEMQIRARFADGSAIASNIMRASADRLLKEGII